MAGRLGARDRRAGQDGFWRAGIITGPQAIGAFGASLLVLRMPRRAFALIEEQGAGYKAMDTPQRLLAPVLVTRAHRPA